jgi:hypothetical protein
MEYKATYHNAWKKTNNDKPIAIGKGISTVRIGPAPLLLLEDESADADADADGNDDGGADEGVVDGSLEDVEVENPDEVASTEDISVVGNGGRDVDSVPIVRVEVTPVA